MRCATNGAASAPCGSPRALTRARSGTCSMRSRGCARRSRRRYWCSCRAIPNASSASRGSAGAAAYGVALRTETRGALPSRCDVLVGDTMGELQRLYAAADVAFIGGSLVPKGGQNLLEACAVNVPPMFGPHMFHFEEIAAMALERGAARQVHDSAGLAAAVGALLRAAGAPTRGRACRAHARDGQSGCARAHARAHRRNARSRGRVARPIRGGAPRRQLRHLMLQPILGVCALDTRLPARLASAAAAADPLP